jgi:hypothetical protein
MLTDLSFNKKFIVKLETKMAEHTKGARGSTWDKHTDQDKGKKQKKQQSSNWVDQGKHTNSNRNKNRSSKDKSDD